MKSVTLETIYKKVVNLQRKVCHSCESRNPVCSQILLLKA